MLDKLTTLGISLVTGIAVARYFGPENLGMWAYAISISSIFTIFVNLGIENIGIAQLSLAKNKKKLLQNFIIFRMIGGLFALVIGTIYISIFEFGIIQYGIFVLLISNIFLCFDSVDYLYQAKRIPKYGIFLRLFWQTSLFIFKIALIFFQMPLSYFFDFTLYSMFLMIIVNYYLSNKILGFNIFSLSFDVSVLKHIFNLTRPMFAAGLLSIIFMNIDKIFLKQLSSFSELGIYSVTFSLSVAYFFFIPAISQACYPRLIKMYDKSRIDFEKEIIGLYGFLFLISIFSGAILYFAGPSILVIVLGEEYIEAGAVMKIFSFYGLLISFTLVSSYWIICTKNYVLSMLRNLFSLILFIPLGYYLIQSYGAIGAAYSFIFCQLIGSLLIMFSHHGMRSNIMYIINSFNVREILKWVKKSEH